MFRIRCVYGNELSISGGIASRKAAFLQLNPRPHFPRGVRASAARVFAPGNFEKFCGSPQKQPRISPQPMRKRSGNCPQPLLPQSHYSSSRCCAHLFPQPPRPENGRKTEQRRRQRDKKVDRKIRALRENNARRPFCRGAPHVCMQCVCDSGRL